MKPSEFIMKKESEWEEEYDDVEFATDEDINDMHTELDKLFISREEVEKIIDKIKLSKYYCYDVGQVLKELKQKLKESK